MTNYFRKPDALVDAVKAVLSGQPTEIKVGEEVSEGTQGKTFFQGYNDRKDKGIESKPIDKDKLFGKKKPVKKEEVNDKSDDGAGLDAVQPNALKKKFKDRKDKDIDNDGDVDKSDEYLHKRRQAVSKAMKEEVELDEKVAAYDKNGKVVGLYRNMADAKRLKPNHTYKIHKEETEDNPANTQHLCAKNVVHESWGEGSCIPTMHADPDEDGNIEWYDVMFDHGIEEQVSIEELKVTKAESHMHSSKKKIEESEDEDEDDMEDDGDDSDEDEKNGKKKKTSGKKDDVDVEPEMDDQQMTSEMSDKQMKKREEIVLSMKKKMPDFKKKYGDRAKDVMYATATKMAMKEGFELGIEKSDLIEEVELDEAKSGTGYDLYHKDFSSAMQHAYDHAKKKHGITINPSEIDNKVASGPRKPSEGKTNTYRLKGDKGAIQVQVYNKGGSKPFELNMYKEETELDEAKVTKKERDRLEDQNEHGLLALKLAKAYGTPAEVKKIEAINKKHQKDGSIERKDQQERDSISNKYYKMAEETDLDEAKSATGKILVADPKTQKVTKIDGKDWPKYEKKGYVQAEGNDLDEGFINIGGAKVKDDEKSILQHIKKTFPNVNKVKKDPQHGWIPVFEELDLDEANVAKMSDDVLKSRLAQMKRAENSPAIQFEIKRLKKEMKKRNIQEESDLDEARGRPRKDGTKSVNDDRENIQMQLRKSVSLRGLKDVDFDDGKKVKVSARDAQSILSKLDAIKAPKERQNAVIHIAKSHNNLVDFASGKSGEMDPEKRKVAFLKGLMKTK
jgi:hypothetical protein